MTGLPLTGERTVPGIPEESYWFARHEAVYRWAAEQTAHLPGPRIDVGSGEGYGAAIFAQVTSWQVVGIELDAAAAAHAHRAYPQVGTVRANAIALPFPARAFGVAVSLQVIEHVWDVPAYLRELARVARTIVIATPNRPVFSPGLGRREKPVNPFHEREFDAEELREELMTAGLLEVRLFGLLHGPRLAAWEADHGGLVAAQVEAVLAGTWPPPLAEFVATITAEDFEVLPIRGEEPWQDLIAMGTAP